LDTEKNSKIVTVHDALEKLRSFCAYQERCHQDVWKKLKTYSLSQNENEHILLLLIQGGYLNEERYTEAFVSGKVTIKKWGRALIKSKLRERGIRDSLITSAMNGIDKAVYFENLTHLCHYKNTLIKESNTQKRKFKLAQYLLSKGYESNLIWEVINDLFNESDSE
jgi:regulatory protein